jgi:hypothetical protein
MTCLGHVHEKKKVYAVAGTSNKVWDSVCVVRKANVLDLLPLGRHAETAVLSPGSAVAHSFSIEGRLQTRAYKHRYEPRRPLLSPVYHGPGMLESCVVALTTMVHFRAALQPCHSPFV